MLSKWLVQRVAVSAVLNLKEKEMQQYCYSESHIIYLYFDYLDFFLCYL